MFIYIINSFTSLNAKHLSLLCLSFCMFFPYNALLGMDDAGKNREKTFDELYPTDDQRIDALSQFIRGAEETEGEFVKMISKISDVKALHELREPCAESTLLLLAIGCSRYEIALALIKKGITFEAIAHKNCAGWTATTFPMKDPRVPEALEKKLEELRNANCIPDMVKFNQLKEELTTAKEHATKIAHRKITSSKLSAIQKSILDSPNEEATIELIRELSNTPIIEQQMTMSDRNELLLRSLVNRPLFKVALFLVENSSIENLCYKSHENIDFFDAAIKISDCLTAIEKKLAGPEDSLLFITARKRAKKAREDEIKTYSLEAIEQSILTNRCQEDVIELIKKHGIEKVNKAQAPQTKCTFKELATQHNKNEILQFLKEQATEELVTNPVVAFIKYLQGLPQSILHNYLIAIIISLFIEKPYSSETSNQS